MWNTGYVKSLRGRQDQRKILGGEEEAKSSRGTSIPTSFVFSTIQFSPVHLHLCYFHSNSRGAIRSIFDIGTWLWKRSCHFFLNRHHEKKTAPPPHPASPLCVLRWASLNRNVPRQSLFFTFTLFLITNQHLSTRTPAQEMPSLHRKEIQSCSLVLDFTASRQNMDCLVVKKG